MATETVFRNSFKLVTKQAIRWHPGHMAKGLKQMQQRLRTVDCVIEVHDARIPLSGRNTDLRASLMSGGVKPHILVLNKKDLTEIQDQRSIVKSLAEAGVDNVLFTNSKDQQCNGIKRIVPLANKLIQASERYNRASEKELSIMIVGVPNVGKSSLINTLRNRILRRKSAAKVGATAGVTRAVMERIKISDDPLMYMVDTPGILEPRIADDEMGLKLALVGCIPDHIVGEDLLADYLLYWMNKHKRYEYVKEMGLQEPNDDIMNVLMASAVRLGAQRKLKKFDGQLIVMPDIVLAARHFIAAFRKGRFGQFNLDK